MTPDLQPSFDDLGTPLPEVTFCVVDLETTGGSQDDAITEIGAVKVRGGVVEGEFQTLVHPGGHIQASVQVLTGITDAMVADAPPIGAVLPSWLEFSRGTVLVAHNARFDVGFLRRACEAADHPWPGNVVVDTLALARSCLQRGEVHNHKLGTLAQLFHATTTPDHRALDDARATVDVLHGLIERVGNLGVTTLEDLLEVTHRVSPARRAKRRWAAELPEGPGVYWFHRDEPGRPREVLYVGTSVDVRRRVAQYFTASETRRRMDEMVRVATGVQARSCATGLEAGVRELRLIAAHEPRYNRRSRRQDDVLWVTLTREQFPRLSVVRSTAQADRLYWGPFSRRDDALEACRVLRETAPLRECTGPLSAHPHGCPLAEMGRCPAPCLDPAGSGYEEVVATARRVMTLDVTPVVRTQAQRIAELSGADRFEDAGALTERVRTFLAAGRRRARIASIARCPQIVAARRIEGRWEVHVVRHGRLAGAALCPAGQNPMPIIESTCRCAETVAAPAVEGLPACSVEEAELVASWLEEDGVRLVDIDGDWSWPRDICVDERALATGIRSRMVG
ncbi:DEDD exonuclease domain-containing protein [Acidipropionibacterium timonense]|uniref:DEDD exonuclease domain-containing protein n=1 Tax=Acidipropionibacterium timonense TaxID=2161818 RepID=UPI0010306944